MLDFDFLAEQRAKALNQSEDGWKKAVWKPEFQALSQSMSDGEVESFIALFSSVGKFAAAVEQLEHRLQNRTGSPHTLIQQEAERAGQTPEQWVEALIEGTVKP
jgi:hypothetical protein